MTSEESENIVHESYLHFIELLLLVHWNNNTLAKVGMKCVAVIPYPIVRTA